METIGYIPDEEEKSTKPTEPKTSKKPTTTDNPTDGEELNDGSEATPKEDGDEAGKK